MNLYCLGIIPARGGSKGVKNKNIRLLDKKPLIQHTIEAANTAGHLDDVLVSTDSETIRSVALEAGANVPFLRPSHLATDESSMVSVVAHALEWQEKKLGKAVDIICLLQPTAPLRDAADIDVAITQFLQHSNSDSLISCYDGVHAHPSIMYAKHDEYLMPFQDQSFLDRRQNFGSIYIRNGCIYLTRREYFGRERRLVGDTPLSFIMPRWKSVNVDEELDLVLAEAVIQARHSSGQW